jgi:hypothetical protein
MKRDLWTPQILLAGNRQENYTGANVSYILWKRKDNWARRVEKVEPSAGRITLGLESG